MGIQHERERSRQGRRSPAERDDVARGALSRSLRGYDLALAGPPPPPPISTRAWAWLRGTPAWGIAAGFGLGLSGCLLVWLVIHTVATGSEGWPK